MAGIFLLGRGGVIATAAKGKRLVAGRDPNLVRIDAEVRSAGLRHFLANGTVGHQPVHRHLAWNVVGDEKIRTAMVGRHMQRPHRQKPSWTKLGQASIRANL
jgi:hypothetical protein